MDRVNLLQPETLNPDQVKGGAEELHEKESSFAAWLAS